MRAIILCLSVCLSIGALAQSDLPIMYDPGPVHSRPVWPLIKANEWYANKGWLRGSDFIPSTAINQLEMWQAATFDPSTIDRELGFAAKHHILTIFVFFDDCWNATYQAGPQPKPKPGIHNSGWLRDPGKRYFDEPRLVDTLEWYVRNVLYNFKHDNRVLLWDLYNEPGNSG